MFRESLARQNLRDPPLIQVEEGGDLMIKKAFVLFQSPYLIG